MMTEDELGDRCAPGEPDARPGETCAPGAAGEAPAPRAARRGGSEGARSEEELPMDIEDVGPLEVQEAATRLFTSIGTFSRTADAFVTRQARERPYAMLGVVAAAGYVLGGGLPSRFTAVIGAAAGRLIVAHVMNSLTAEKPPSEEGGSPEGASR